MTTGTCLWFCGLPGSGRRTIATLVANDLASRDVPVELLDGDDVREHLMLSVYRADPASEPDLERLAYVARLLTKHGVVVVVAADATDRATRDRMREAIGDAFVDVLVDTPPDVCAQRAGREAVDAARFEPPVVPTVRVLTHDRAPTASAAQVVSHLEASGLVAALATA